jgi:protein-disulfide isomerase
MTQSMLTLPVSGRDHTLGPANAPATLLEYGDYECPHCGAAYPVVEALRERLGDLLRFAYRHFPLSQIHPHAELDAEAAEAAGAQGKFWDMHHALFTHQDALDGAHLMRYAAAIGLDMGAFQRDLETQAYAGRVREDFMSGVRSGVNGTPTFFINGARYEGSHDFATMLEVLNTVVEAAVVEAAVAEASRREAVR